MNFCKCLYLKQGFQLSEIYMYMFLSFFLQKYVWFCFVISEKFIYSLFFLSTF